MFVAQPVGDLFGGQACEQQVGAKVWFRGSGPAQEVAAVLAPEGVRASAQPGSGGGGLRQQDQVELGGDQVEVTCDECAEPGCWCGTGSQRRFSGEDALLQLAFAFV